MKAEAALELAALLEEPPERLVAGPRAAFRQAAGSNAPPLALFGAGSLGRSVLARLRRAGRTPLYFADNSPALWGEEVDGLEVLPPDEAVSRARGEVVFIVTIYNGGSVLRQLARMQGRAVSHPVAAWAMPEVLLPHCALDLPDAVVRDAPAVRAAGDLWADAASRKEYVAQLLWRLTLDADVLPAPLPAAETYFPRDLLPEPRDEVFVDCGAFDGDSIRAFMERRGSAFREIVAVEADPTNAARLASYVASLPEGVGSRVAVHACAVGAEPGSVLLEGSGPEASQGATGVLVPCQPLDELLRGSAPTFIKMDIEGAEESALLGCQETIRRHRPVLAISLYHRPADLWRLPALIRALEPSYGLFLRRYAEDCWEQVCYALPGPVRAGHGGES